MRFPGIIPAVTTPFDASGAIDFDGAREQRRRAARRRRARDRRHRHDGRGRQPLDRRAPRTVVAAVARAAVDGRVPVIAGVSAGTPAAAIALAADAAEAGADALMMLPPLGYRGDDDEIVAHYRSVAEAAGLPLMAYNNPEASGIDMGTDLLARLYEEVDQIVAVKECSGDARRIPALIDAAPGARGARRRRRLGARGLLRRRRPAGSAASPTSPRATASRSTTPAAAATSTRRARSTAACCRSRAST